MGTRGLPAMVRAVPANLLRRLRVALGGRRRSNGARLLGLISRLPPDLRALALTHASQVTDRVESNERLEFLGDSVLGLVVTAELFDRYPEWDEGDLARLKASAVSRASCAEVAELLGVGEMLWAERADSDGGRRDGVRSRTMAGNALEALLGAVFLKYGFEDVQTAVVDAFEDRLRGIPEEHVDAKTALQELLAARGLRPEYRLLTESGPAHAKVFTSEVLVSGTREGEGTGTTIKMSEQEAAKVALASYAARGREA